VRTIKLKCSIPIYVFKFKGERNYSGWNIVFSSEKAADFILEKLKDMEASPYTLKYILDTAYPSKELIAKINKYLINSKIKKIRKLNLILKPNTQNCIFDKKDEELDLIFGKNKLSDIKYILKRLKEEHLCELGAECDDEILIFWLFR